MFRVALLATAASAIHILAPAGDPECKMGHRSFSATPESELAVCCPSYCGKCNDYAGCEAVNGQDSQYACCASKVQEKVCENNSSDPYCLGSCDSKSAPCSLGMGATFEKPAETSASEDCGEAVGEFKAECEASVKSVAPASPTGGESQWKGIQERKDAASSADDAKFAKNMDNSGRGGTSTM